MPEDSSSVSDHWAWQDKLCILQDVTISGTLDLLPCDWTASEIKLYSSPQGNSVRVTAQDNNSIIEIKLNMKGLATKTTQSCRTWCHSLRPGSQAGDLDKNKILKFDFQKQ